MAFDLSLVPSCTKEDFKKAISDAVTPVGLKNDTIDLQISLLKPKYLTRERPPTVIVRNKELNLPLRLILEDYITQMVRKIKDAGEEAKQAKDDWLLSFLKLLEGVFHSLIEKAIEK